MGLSLPLYKMKLHTSFRVLLLNSGAHRLTWAGGVHGKAGCAGVAVFRVLKRAGRKLWLGQQVSTPAGQARTTGYLYLVCLMFSPPAGTGVSSEDCQSDLDGSNPQEETFEERVVCFEQTSHSCPSAELVKRFEKMNFFIKTKGLK